MMPSRTALAGQKATSRLGGRVKMPTSENRRMMVATDSRTNKGLRVDKMRWCVASPMRLS
ncbi:hypothetical protein D3C78_1625600 [compost metagenome]